MSNSFLCILLLAFQIAPAGSSKCKPWAAFSQHKYSDKHFFISSERVFGNRRLKELKAAVLFRLQTPEAANYVRTFHGCFIQKPTEAWPFIEYHYVFTRYPFTFSKMRALFDTLSEEQRAQFYHKLGSAYRYISARGIVPKRISAYLLAFEDEGFERPLIGDLDFAFFSDMPRKKIERRVGPLSADFCTRECGRVEVTNNLHAFIKFVFALEHWRIAGPVQRFLFMEHLDRITRADVGQDARYASLKEGNPLYAFLHDYLAEERGKDGDYNPFLFELQLLIKA